MLTGLFGGNTPAVTAQEFDFDVGSSRVFADLGGSVAAAGTFGIQVFDAGGTETQRESFRMATPAIDSSSGRAVAFDIGGTALYVFSEKQITASLTVKGAIISASINRNGWFCVCSQEDGAYLSIVTVYNNTGTDVYKVSLASGYAASAALSPDNKRLAVLNLKDSGSEVSIYDLSRETPDGAFELPGGLILDVRFLQESKLVAVTSESLIAIDAVGNGAVLYDFSGMRLGGFVPGNGFIALYLLDYGVGYSGRLVTLGEDGSPLGELATDKEIVSMSSGEGFLAVLQSDGISLFDTELNGFTADGNSPSIAGATKTVSLSEDSALAASDHFAIVIRFERSANH